MKKITSGILLAALALIGCGEEKSAKIDAMFRAKEYIRLQEFIASDLGRLGTPDELIQAAKKVNSKTFPPQDNEFFAFKIETNIFGISSKVEIDGCPAQTVWLVGCRVEKGNCECMTDEDESIYNNQTEKVPEACKKVFGEEYRSLGK